VTLPRARTIVFSNLPVERHTARRLIQLLARALAVFQFACYNELHSHRDVTSMPESLCQGNTAYPAHYNGAAAQHAPGRNLVGMTRQELEQLALENDQPRYRGAQLYHAIYNRRERDFARCTDLNRNFRELLGSKYELSYPSLERAFVSRDGTVRYLFRLEDGEVVEAVYMPDESRTTLCISSQVGCAVDCRFCFTALLGVRRNLTAGEIVGQVLAITVECGIPRHARLNVVFMGQGEPLLNFAQVMKGVSILADPEGMGIVLKRITISTSGIAPRILDLAREALRPKLALSLNASNDEQRTAIMPINRKYPLKDLLAACRAYPLRPREYLTFEYVMLDGVNDSDEDAVRATELMRGMRAKVNLIPYNCGPGLPYRASPIKRVLQFQKVLVNQRVPTYIRISRGQDIMGACGQLSLAEITA
jgi:23S rRNA (adenine2503-C2)-methyltransferase